MLLRDFAFFNHNSIYLDLKGKVVNISMGHMIDSICIQCLVPLWISPLLEISPVERFVESKTGSNAPRTQGCQSTIPEIPEPHRPQSTAELHLFPLQDCGILSTLNVLKFVHLFFPLLTVLGTWWICSIWGFMTFNSGKTFKD